MRNALRRCGIPLIFLASIFWGACGGGGGDGSSQVSNTNFEASEPFSLIVDKGSRFRVSLEGVNGDVSISGSPGATSVTIAGTKRVRSQSIRDAQAHLQADLDVDIQELTDEVSVKTVQPPATGGRSYVVDYTITLPENFDVLITNVNGPVTINGIVGSALVLVALVNGVIDAKVTLPLNGTTKFNVVNGGINLTIPTNTSAKFLAQASTGRISLSPNLVLQNVIRSPNPLEGTLGTGDGTVELKIVNGDVNVSGF